ncbi:hypothetical protein ONE63_002521 [Megalurothrips usitatus]|uniref:Nucleoporin NUP42 n=1 Tax=Megalurothrips usitatus TaxID=439358 RepID=A0AAV7XBF6_9NEOP|nr:hypothetical protein ONE63_002521 [Megalurothrips usitatus]
MVVCRYYQQGTCRFGQNCRFEHPSPQYGSTYVSPLLRSSQPPPNVTAPRNVPANHTVRTTMKDARDVHNLIVKDINESEKGGVWPLSCYNFWPAATHSNVPGLEDLSPEEMRHLQMQAQATGTIDACNQQIQQMYQQARARFNSLKIPNPETLSTIESLTRGPAAPSSQFSFARGSNVAQDSWPSTNQSSVFGGSSTAQGQNSIFGGSSSSTTGFGSSQTPAFGAASNQQGIFGGSSQFTSPTSPQKSIFGGAVASQPQQSSSYGNSSQQTSIFGAAAQQAASPFGGPSVQTTSPFGGVAQTQPVSSVFGGAPTVGHSGGSIFGGSSAPPAAAASSFSFALPNTFAGNSANPVQGGNPFGAPPSNAPNVFGGGTAQAGAQPAGNVFGYSGAPKNMSSPVVQQSNISLNTTLYTSMAQLSSEEKSEYEADTFTLGKIPCRPPPRELC